MRILEPGAAAHLISSGYAATVMLSIVVVVLLVMVLWRRVADPLARWFGIGAALLAAHNALFFGWWYAWRALDAAGASLATYSWMASSAWLAAIMLPAVAGPLVYIHVLTAPTRGWQCAFWWGVGAVVLGAASWAAGV